MAKTWADITRSTEVEFKAFKRGLDRLAQVSDIRGVLKFMDDKWNIKPRVVICPRCKVSAVTAEPAPIHSCGAEMITVVPGGKHDPDSNPT